MTYIKCCLIATAGLLVCGTATTARNPVATKLGETNLGERSPAQVGIVVSFGPPELPVYEQPICPADGYFWTPGYWAWDDDDDDYYWVPGTWILPPEAGFFWTPGYWAWGGSGFVFYEGYWGPVVGFYGGVNYGYGYFGHGYEGGRWESGHFYYNTTVNRINVTEIHNVYNTTVVTNNNTRVSYNGGSGGLNARPTAQEQAAAGQRHVPPVAAQTQNVQAARTDSSLRASQNHGKPPIAATARPATFSGGGVVPAKEGGRYNPPPPNERKASRANPSNNPSNPPPASSSRPATPNTAIHPSELPPHARSEAPNTGNSKLDKEYQQEQDKLRAKQEQEHQKLQQKQDQEHQRLEKQQANEARKQQVEQQHQHQTQQMEQRHAQEQQQMQQRQQPPPPKPRKD